MKKNHSASQLAAKLSEAAGQPAGTGKPPLPPVPSKPLKAERTAAEVPTPIEPNSNPRKAEGKESTVIITLRPRLTLWKKCVALASERMRKEGRAVSPQQIILEVLERGIT
jgi:hypothetical protein